MSSTSSLVRLTSASSVTDSIYTVCDLQSGGTTIAIPANKRFFLNFRSNSDSFAKFFFIASHSTSLEDSQLCDGSSSSSSNSNPSAVTAFPVTSAAQRAILVYDAESKEISETFAIIDKPKAVSSSVTLALYLSSSCLLCLTCCMCCNIVCGGRRKQKLN